MPHDTRRSAETSVPSARDDRGELHENSPALAVLWQDAQERALLYLKMLGVDPIQSLELTRRALLEASSTQATESSADAVRCVMKVLRHILVDEPKVQERLDNPHETLYCRWRGKSLPEDGLSGTASFDLSRESLTAPPLNRESMSGRKI